MQRGKPVAGRYSFTTWEEYVGERWDMTPQHCNRLIESAVEAGKLNKFVQFLPSRESHVRELLKLETDEQRAEVWQQWEKDQAKKRQGARTDIVETFPQSEQGKSRDKAGKRVGVSGKSPDLRTKPPDLRTKPAELTTGANHRTTGPQKHFTSKTTA